uniref:Pentatricopeptide repeat-containing protein n=1 Tax=Lactuca sativa TaxID=4236 RepID=A0A9R1V8D6_LACSA|nr:hypothetical protein LSAT_V11C600310880 [Lactuca sativa]
MMRVFKCIKPKYGIQPSMEDYDCMISILIKASKLDEVVNLIEEMPVEPTEEMWDALFAFEHLIKFNIFDTELYQKMLNLSSDGDLIKRMTELGIGVSWGPGCRGYNVDGEWS